MNTKFSLDFFTKLANLCKQRCYGSKLAVFSKQTW